MRMVSRWLLGFALLASVAAAQAQPFIVFAAASLKNAMDEVAALSPAKPAVAYAASSALARQIESGAPAQVFISADLAWMDYLDARKLLKAGTRRNLLGNTLALVAPAGNTVTAVIRPGFALASLLGGGRLALGDPRHVPAGRYARTALEKLGVWDSVSARLAPAENVRVALALVARGEAPLGIVYSSDAASEPRVRVVATFPGDSLAPIVYPAALTARATGDAAAFLAMLASPPAREVFERHGFTPLN
ncbi:MAG: molybdate ABC transporter substrate-binding protein [Burkholderiales bacterium]